MSIEPGPFKSLLEKRRDELNALLASGEESTKPVELDQSSVGRVSRIDAIQLQAMAQAEASRRREELQRIDAAFKRIDTGDFGYCLSCDEEIAKKRLELDPTTTSCIRCASKREQQ